jgi:hypothetical protein
MLERFYHERYCNLMGYVRQQLSSIPRAEEMKRLRSNLERWLFTQTAKGIARRDLAERIKEAEA